MAMAACYPASYLQSSSRVPLETYQSMQVPSMETYQPNSYMKPRVPPTDYSIPLHVDCSVEYELPDCAKPPQGVKIEPLLMIHPCHFRNLERQRRRPFENNLPVKNTAQKSRVPQYSCEYSMGEFSMRNRGSIAGVRSHPYAAPCAPRVQQLPYSIQHHPTLIYNV